MLFGDSITQGGWEDGGFGARLARKHAMPPRISTILSHFVDVYSRKFDVLNRGLSGYNSEWAIPVFEQVCTAIHTQIIRQINSGSCIVLCQTARAETRPKDPSSYYLVRGKRCLH